MDSLKELINEAREKRDKYQRLLDNLIEAQKEFGDNSEPVVTKTDFTRKTTMKKTDFSKISDEALIVQIIEKTPSSKSVSQIKGEMQSKGREIADNALSSRLSRLVKAGKIVRLNRGLYSSININVDDSKALF